MQYIVFSALAATSSLIGVFEQDYTEALAWAIVCVLNLTFHFERTNMKGDNANL